MDRSWYQSNSKTQGDRMRMCVMCIVNWPIILYLVGVVYISSPIPLSYILSAIISYMLKIERNIWIFWVFQIRTTENRCFAPPFSNWRKWFECARGFSASYNIPPIIFLNFFLNFYWSPIFLSKTVGHRFGHIMLYVDQLL